MSRTAARRQLSRDGWLMLLLILVPVLASSQLPRVTGSLSDDLAFPLFFAGLALLFLSLPRFTAYKHALIDTEKSFDSDAEPAAWTALRLVRLRALRVAGLPAWVAALVAPLGLEPVGQLLLVCGSLTLLLLYRVPRQLQ
ncbi:hypothetical protein [Stutzerimonas zhaodongensis]|uniref:hypothetical protein n=1 Tax=Stutzerimonas zhaodongensis TaxID=1176257 RepID=UPI0021084590|nr:hypothetical protein [Stutzerimonas zhaodongensis]